MTWTRKEYIERRTIAEGIAIAVQGLTVREVAHELGIGHNTVWHDVRFRLPVLDSELARQVHQEFKKHTHNRKTLRSVWY